MENAETESLMSESEMRDKIRTNSGRTIDTKPNLKITEKVGIIDRVEGSRHFEKDEGNDMTTI